jgi:hypothetical protein
MAYIAENRRKLLNFWRFFFIGSGHPARLTLNGLKGTTPQRKDGEKASLSSWPMRDYSNVGNVVEWRPKFQSIYLDRTEV